MQRSTQLATECDSSGMRGGVWEDYSVPGRQQTFTMRLGCTHVSVVFGHPYEPSKWVAIGGPVFEYRVLAATTADEAKAEVTRSVAAKLREMLDAIEQGGAA